MKPGTLLLLIACAGMTAAAGILPDRLAGALKSDVKPFPAADAALFEEYGFEGGEQAAFGPTTLKVWQFRDATGAMAAFQFARPADAKPEKTNINQMSAVAAGGLMNLYANYVVQVSGKVPAEDQLAEVYLALKKVEKAPLPVISAYLPAEGLIPNSERYVLGPVSLAKFSPSIPPSVAAFSLSAEAQLGQYRTKNGVMTLAVFNYPTPSMSRERAEEFRKVPGAVAKRTGPMVVVVTGASDADAAERVLAKVNYQAQVTVNEKGPNKDVQSFAKTIVNYILFSGVIVVFCVLSGAFVAGAKILMRKIRGEEAEADPMITLHLDGQKPPA
ncbi:MAG: hypothetical protein JSU00_31095 [Acidobacteria bacterium]|nr:hypothetical protein [Acidobacteriota bacterium]